MINQDTIDPIIFAGYIFHKSAPKCDFVKTYQSFLEYTVMQ